MIHDLLFPRVVLFSSGDDWANTTATTVVRQLLDAQVSIFGLFTDDHHPTCTPTPSPLFLLFGTEHLNSSVTYFGAESDLIQILSVVYMFYDYKLHFFSFLKNIDVHAYTHVLYSIGPLVAIMFQASSDKPWSLTSTQKQGGYNSFGHVEWAYRCRNIDHEYPHISCCHSRL